MYSPLSSPSSSPSSFPPSPLSSPLFPIYEDILIHCLTPFFTLDELHKFGAVCEDFHRVKTKTRHFKHYKVTNSDMVEHCQQQYDLKSVQIQCVRNVQLFFSSLPEYTCIGHFSSLYPTNKFNGMLTGAKRDNMFYPKVKTLYIDEAYVDPDIDWGAFPNLEELFISSSASSLLSLPTLSIDSLWKCSRLKKVIIKTSEHIVSNDNRILQLPNLEVFAITGSIIPYKPSLNSPKLTTIILFNRRWEYPYRVFDELLKIHYNPPKECKL